MAEVDRGMDVGEMKKLLSKSKTEPVNMAFAVNGKTAVMLLDKVKQPKALSAILEKKYAEAKNVRWGTAAVDLEDDPKLVVLTVKRAASGVGRLLKKTLKGTGFSKVRIQLEDGSVVESVAEEDEEEEGAAAPAAAAAPAPGEPAPSAAAEPAPAAAAESEKPAVDIGALTQRLGVLMKQLPQSVAAAPAQAGNLKDLATKAVGAVKGGSAAPEAGQAAVAAVDALETELKKAAGGASNGQTAKTPNMADLQKSTSIWVATCNKIEAELGKLHEAMVKHYSDSNFGAELEKVFQSKIQPIKSSLEPISKKLTEVSSNKDPAQLPKLVSEAQQMIASYESFVASDPLVSQLDDNPFVPLTIVKTTQTTLSALKSTMAKAA